MLHLEKWPRFKYISSWKTMEYLCVKEQNLLSQNPHGIIKMNAVSFEILLQIALHYERELIETKRDLIAYSNDI